MRRSSAIAALVGYSLLWILPALVALMMVGIGGLRVLSLAAAAAEYARGDSLWMQRLMVWWVVVFNPLAGLAAIFLFTQSDGHNDDV